MRGGFEVDLANPGGLPKSVFDGLQVALAANRSIFYREGRPATVGEVDQSPNVLELPDGPYRAVSLRSFDPVLVGRLECALWMAYYRRRWPRPKPSRTG